MSEYQYYEFQAIDRPLTRNQMSELRNWSTRAEITPHRFVNEYHWGNFKGDADAWMRRYFDAFLYLANWGTHIFKLRLPSNVVARRQLAPYLSRSSFDVDISKEHLILSFVAQDEDGDGECDTDDVLSALIPIRDEIARGDFRALYIGWLLGAQRLDFGPDALEPPVPPGLDELSDALEELVDFLRIDDDLLDVAAKASAPMIVVEEPTKEAIMDWLVKQPIAERDHWLMAALFDGAAPTLAEIQRRYRKEHAPEVRTTQLHQARRTVGELLNAAEARADEREQIAKQDAAEREERRRMDEEILRKIHLNGLVGQENRLWAEADALAKTKQPLKYDAAVQLLRDLRDLADRTGDNEFGRRLDVFRTTHARKPSLLERITKANLSPRDRRSDAQPATQARN